MERRAFIKLLGGGTAGVALGGAGYASAVATAAPAPPDGRSATATTFVYRGRRVTITQTAHGPMLTIDGRVMPHHVFSEVDGSFVSHLLPFETRPDPVSLVRLLVDEDGLGFVL